MLLRLDKKGPLYGQVYRAIRAEILAGRITAGERVAPTRWLAAELGLSRNVVMLAYEQLAAEGYVEARVGAGSFVARELPGNGAEINGAEPVPETPRASAMRLSEFARRMIDDVPAGDLRWNPRQAVLPYDFRYGRPSLTDFPHDAWCRTLARRARRASVRDLDYGPPDGVPALRESIAAYLARARGVRCSGQDVIVVSGSQQALDLSARVLVDPGDCVVLEEPHYRAARAAMRAAGARIVTVAVDEHGLRTSELNAQRGVRLVVTTPSHQFPTGAVMPLARRLELLAWAEREDAIIFEDDYDSEYRYSGRPIEAMQALDQSGRVIYAGTFSKLMYPAMRLGYIVAPPSLTGALRSAKALADTGSATLMQLALVDFIRAGHFESHLRRTRTRNAARRAVLLDAIARNLGDRAEVLGVNAGLHIMMRLPGIPASATGQIRAQAEAVGVGAYSMAQFYLGKQKAAELLIGYASMPEHRIAEGIERLANVIKAVSREYEARE